MNSRVYTLVSFKCLYWSLNVRHMQPSHRECPLKLRLRYFAYILYFVFYLFKLKKNLGSSYNGIVYHTLTLSVTIVPYYEAAVTISYVLYG